MKVIDDKCISCTACVSTCPVDAIIMKPENNKADINKEKCILCGACASICPVGAIEQ